MILVNLFPEENLVVMNANHGVGELPVVPDVEIIDLVDEDELMNAVAAEIQDYAQAAEWGEGWEIANHYCPFCRE